MLDDIIEAMELKNGDICSNYDYSCAEEHAMDDDTYSLSDALEKNSIYKIYICISEPTNVAKYLVGITILFIYLRLGGRGGELR